ncbi:hypothetical protein Zm00014a_032372 [Zea mays]|uniref:Uncharacterized protein n=1 Tax=Zea mays TaxID=4577 RepID=A0A3L6EC29_MAIZE|nr:hypothetical protein Zm00014a_032372 [Zea mays]
MAASAGTPALYGSDDRIQACMAELGVPLTKHPRFHQYDVYDDLLGLLASHPGADRDASPPRRSEAAVLGQKSHGARRTMKSEDKVAEILNKSQTAATSRHQDPWCRSRVPESGKLILELIVQLWSKSFATNIFALLFHKWLFEALLTKKKYRYDIALLLFKVLQKYFVSMYYLVRISRTISPPTGSFQLFISHRVLFLAELEAPSRSAEPAYLAHFPTLTSIQLSLTCPFQYISHSIANSANCNSFNH